MVYTADASHKEAVIDLNDNADVVITGNGTFTFDDDYLDHNDIGYIFRLQDSAKLTIENGTYYAGLTCVQAGDNAVAMIKGGTFRASSAWNDVYWLLNLIDNSEAKIIVTGGIFENYDPSHSKTENPEANFCAEGYVTTSEENDGSTFYAVEAATAKTDSKYYATLAEAVQAVVSSESKTGTVTL